jgi:hypothetical protein
MATLHSETVVYIQMTVKMYTNMFENNKKRDKEWNSSPVSLTLIPVVFRVEAMSEYTFS